MSRKGAEKEPKFRIEPKMSRKGAEKEPKFRNEPKRSRKGAEREPNIKHALGEGEPKRSRKGDEPFLHENDHGARNGADCPGESGTSQMLGICWTLALLGKWSES